MAGFHNGSIKLGNRSGAPSVIPNSSLIYLEGNRLKSVGNASGIIAFTTDITGGGGGGDVTQITNSINDLYATKAASSTLQAISGGNFSFNSVRIGTCTRNITSNTALGQNVLIGNTFGARNTAVGVDALRRNTTGNGNIAIGFLALEKNTTGQDNVAVGTYSMNKNNGSYNVAIGLYSMNNTLYSTHNTALGVNALNLNNYGQYNTALGSNALYNATSDYNVAVGYYSLFSTTSNNNVGVGYRTLYTNTSGTNNTAIGDQADVSSTNSTYRTAIGADSSCLNDSTIRCGRASTDTLRGYNYTADSDRRLKENIVDLELGLNFVMTLRPVSYKWKDRTFITKKEDGTTEENRLTYHRNHCGFIAQEIGESLKAIGKDFGIYQDSGVANGITEELPVDMNNYKDPIDLKGYSVEQMLAIAVKAIQELKSKNDELEARIVALESV